MFLTVRFQCELYPDFGKVPYQNQSGVTYSKFIYTVRPVDRIQNLNFKACNVFGKL